MKMTDEEKKILLSRLVRSTKWGVWGCEGCQMILWCLNFCMCMCGVWWC